MGAVAEWLVARLSAAAKRHGGLIGWQRKRSALAIEQSELAFDEKRTIRPTADRNRHGNTAWFDDLNLNR